MLDVGMLVSALVIYATLALAARWAPISTPGRTDSLDRLLAPAFAGVLVARLVAAALDDRASLKSVRAFLVLRGGVEFWAGVAVFGLLVVRAARRQGDDVGITMAELVPFALWGVAAYAATCFLRDGCYGPASPIGLVPAGFHDRQFPIGVAVGLVLATLGAAIRQLWSWSPRAKVLTALGGVAAVRFAASLAVPRLSRGLDRWQIEDLAVVALAGTFSGVTYGLRRHRSGSTWDGPVQSIGPDGVT